MVSVGDLFGTRPDDAVRTGSSARLKRAMAMKRHAAAERGCEGRRWPRLEQFLVIDGLLSFLRDQVARRPPPGGPSMATHSNPIATQNRLLASLAAADRQRLHPHLEALELPYKASLYEANEPIEHVYFITSGVASLVNTMRNRDAAEVGTVGNEGIVGLPILLCNEQSPTSVYMQVPGAGLRVKADVFRHELLRSDTIRTAFLRYVHAFFNQVAQSAACAHFHTLERRCCRWLLMTHDRVHADEFLLTHEFLGMMLGVRRASVTIAAGALKKRGLIRYKRGHVTILDAAGLQELSCECYGVTKREFDRLLGDGEAG
jgi:CRP-like cAMP-binding protein